MVWYECNSTLEYEKIDEAKIWHNMEFHHFGLILSALFGLIAVFMSWYLIFMHCTHYLKPWEQKHIIRVLFMVPIYSIVSFLSYLFYRHAVYFEVIRDCYEAFAIASFFALVCSYISPTLHDQKDYFRLKQPRSWIWPLPWFKRCCGNLTRTPRSGLTQFNIIWVGVFQYCFVRVFMTFVALITQATGRYCQESLNPVFAHVWVMVIEGACVSVAMYCLLQFYVWLKADLSDHQPGLKILAIKLVIFLSFWQTLIISFLTSAGAIKSSNKIQTPDIKIGIPSMLLCIEMALFSVFHLWAFPWKVYDVKRSPIVAAESASYLPDPKTAYKGGPFGIKALIEAFNVWDLFKNVGRGFRWFYKGRKMREQDAIYRANGTGLEPTRNQVTAFRSDDQAMNPFNENEDAAMEPEPYVRGGKTSPYHPLPDEDDAFAQPHAVNQDPFADSEYPRPMERLPRIGENAKIGVYDPPAKGKTPNSHFQKNSITTQPSLQSQDTSYHGASDSYRDSTRLAPVPPPDPHPLGPPGRKSHEQEEWDMWGGVAGAERESERDLGGGHGVEDNRF